MRRRELRRAALKLFADEKALAVITEGAHDGGTLSVQGGGTWKKGDPQGLPSLAMDAEHFGRIARLLEKKKDVQLEIDVKVRFIEEEQMQWNTIAEIPGTDKKAEVVMLGAHLDSWHGGTGATDNGAGVGRRDGGRAHPPGSRRQAEAHDSDRPLERRGAGAHGLARLCRAALRLAARAATFRPRRDAVLPAAGPRAR